MPHDSAVTPVSPFMTSTTSLYPRVFIAYSDLAEIEIKSRDVRFGSSFIGKV